MYRVYGVAIPAAACSKCSVSSMRSMGTQKARTEAEEGRRQEGRGRSRHRPAPAFSLPIELAPMVSPTPEVRATELATAAIELLNSNRQDVAPAYRHLRIMITDSTLPGRRTQLAAGALARSTQ